MSSQGQMIYLQIGLQGIWKPGRCSGSVLLHFLVVFSTAPPFKQIVLDRCLLKEILFFYCTNCCAGAVYSASGCRPGPSSCRPCLLLKVILLFTSLSHILSSASGCRPGPSRYSLILFITVSLSLKQPILCRFMRRCLLRRHCRGAVICGAVVCGAVVCGAVVCGAVVCGGHVFLVEGSRRYGGDGEMWVGMGLAFS
jgi:hypothetical protein